MTPSCIRWLFGYNIAIASASTFLLLLDQSRHSAKVLRGLAFCLAVCGMMLHNSPEYLRLTRICIHRTLLPEPEPEPG